MKNKVKILSIILFFTALLTFIPRVSRAYDTDAEVPINYTIKINKVDSADNRNLKGAKFTLKDVNGKIVATQTTDDDGILSFGNIKTYGSGTDIYYIEEVKTPRGYILDEKETIEVNVEKTVTNVETGGYKLKITCQTLNYDTDITRYDFVPISTRAELEDIGSGAVHVYDGKPYKYTANTNYRLMNDIDLSDSPWTPISVPVSGIFDGNGHSIKNMTIASSNNFSYKEVGLFKVYSGIVSDLNMENVTIAVPGYTELATSISGKGGVGAFAGFMGSGTMKNCTVSGSISSNVDNVGGLVGHTDENVIIKLQNCINYANITAYDSSATSYSASRYNVGGLIGCAMCSLSVNNCSNEGTFNGNASNVGGLIGHVESEGYEEKAVKAGYAEDGNTITLAIGNSRSEGEYDLYLEDYDLRSLNILPGGVFTVYDSTLEPIEGFENVTLEEGRLRIGTVNIKFEGRDTYFVKDITPVEGYRKIAGYIKVVVTRYWDFDAEKFRVTVDSKVIDENKIQEELGNNTDIDLDSISDTFAPEITFENVGWNTAKAVFVGCTNNGVINAYRDVGGLVGSAHFAKVSFEDCTNNKAVSANGYGKAAGIIAELYCWEDGITSEFTNCKNYGKIISNSSGGYGSSAGIAGQVVSNINVSRCINEGEVQAYGQSGASGILCDATGIINIDNSRNKGTIETNYNYGSGAEAGGIIAKNLTGNVTAKPYGFDNAEVSRNRNILTITNCENTGNIHSSCHIGGMVGFTQAGVLTIDNCKVYGTKDNEKVEIHELNAGDKGTMAGFVCVPVVRITDCTAENVDMRRTGPKTSDTYGATGGILGNWCKYGSVSCDLTNLQIKDCSISKSNIISRGQNVGGVLGGVDENANTVLIDGCSVDDCTIHNEYGNATYASAAGILGMIYCSSNVIIENCDVTNSPITLWDEEHRASGDCNVAGIMGMLYGGNTIVIDNCNVINSKLKNYCAPDSICANTAGILGCTHNSVNLYIDNCSYVGADKENKTKEDADIFTIDGNCGGITGNLYVANSIITNTTLKDSYCLSNAISKSNSPMSAMVPFTSNTIKMEDCSVDNVILNLETTNSKGGTNVAGFLGATITYNELIFTNCDISNSIFISNGTYLSMANIAGVLGFTCGDVKITGCDTYNCKFTGNNLGENAPAAANVAGILGCANGKATITDSTVKKCEMSSLSTVGSNMSNCTIAGMVGRVENAVISNSSVENCKLNGSAMCTGGVLACATGSAKLSGVSATNIDIYDRRKSTGYPPALRCIGGVVGYAKTFTGTGITASDVDIDSQSLTIGGIVATTSSAGFNLIGSNVSDITVTNKTSEVLMPKYGCIAGLVGCTSMDYGPANTPTITGCTVSNATFTGDYDTVAGLVGCMSGTATISGCTVTGFTGLNKNTFAGETNGHSGGLIGISTNATVTVNNSKVNNSSITINSIESGPVKHLGGLIGISGDVTFNECEANSVSLTNNAGGCTGGLVGQVDKTETNTRTVTANGSKVTGSVTISSVNHAGGMVGCGKIIATKPTVSGITVRATGDYASAGGIAGITEVGSSIEDADVSEIVVTAKQHVAGMAAVMKGTVSGGTVSTVTITSTGSGVYEAGAVAGVLEGSLSGTTIDSATISSVAGDVGGAVGATTGSVSNVTVTNTSVSSSKIIGGVVGAGATGATTLSNLTVDDATVENIKAVEATFKGKYIGAPNMYEDNEIVDETQEETPTEGNEEDPTNTPNSVNPLSMASPMLNTNEETNNTDEEETEEQENTETTEGLENSNEKNNDETNSAENEETEGNNETESNSETESTEGNIGE